MTDDPFSAILRFTNAETTLSGGLIAGGAWALCFPEIGKLKFFAVIKGACWLRTGDQTAPMRAEAGDVFLLSTPSAFVLASDLAADPLNALELFTSDRNAFARIGNAEDCVLIGGFVKLDPTSGPLLSDMLPPLIHVRAAAPQAAVLQWLLDQFVRERQTELPGSDLVSAQLAQLMFVHILRVHLLTSDSLPAGWLRAISDQQIAPALRLMHSDPGRSWHLEDLARATAMSRTTFALRFKQAAGVAPLTYLMAWRMRLAERALRDGTMPIAEIAGQLGYASESAFSNAFKRVIGRAPRRYRADSRAK